MGKWVDWDWVELRWVGFGIVGDLLIIGGWMILGFFWGIGLFLKKLKMIRECFFLCLFNECFIFILLYNLIINLFRFLLNLCD